MTAEVRNGPPYVVSGDLNLVMREWAKRAGKVVPASSYFHTLSSDLRGVLRNIFGSCVDYVEEGEMGEGINYYAGKSDFPVVSMDRIYFNPNLPNFSGHIDVTRALNTDLEDMPDVLYARQGYSPLNKQFDELKTDKVEPVTVIDDVLFSGKGFVWLAKQLAARNRPVRKAVFGIAIGEGLERLKQIGVETICVRVYPEVIDEICERDFFGAVPYSGRTVICNEGKCWGAPYFLPFGRADKWASIPEEVIPEYSRYCLRQSIELWRQIEDLSDARITTDDVPRKIFRMKSNGSIVDALKESLDF